MTSSHMLKQSDNERISAMREGGKILARVREEVVQTIKPGVSFEELEQTAQLWLKKLGAEPSFPTVEGYQWATCITKNEGCCHGIPKNGVVENGDIITVDTGALYKGYHTDTSITVCAGTCTKEILHFLEVGRQALKAAIARVLPGNTIYTVSQAMQDVIEKAGCRSVYQLTGHGIGKTLHMLPNIPCYADERSKKDVIQEGQTLAIEPMYAWGNPTLALGKDGWTYETVDKSLTGMFEHTVVAWKDGPEVLTDSPLEKDQGI